LLIIKVPLRMTYMLPPRSPFLNSRPASSHTVWRSSLNIATRCSMVSSAVLLLLGAMAPPACQAIGERCSNQVRGEYQQLLYLLDPLGDRAASFVRSELVLDLEKRLVGAVETMSQDRGDVESDGRINRKQRRCVSDEKL